MRAKCGRRIEAKRGELSADPRRARWGGLALICIAGLTSIFAAACSPAPDERPTPVILIAIDTLRADRLGLFGCELDTSPELDAFGAGATVFEAHVTQVNSTFPSMTSILTGVSPRTHGNYAAIPVEGMLAEGSSADLPSLAERLSAAGYHTTAVWSHPLWTGDFWRARSRAAVRRGFQHEASIPEHYSPAERVARDGFVETNTRVFQALERWSQEDADKPLMLWAHYFDPHTPYAPPAAERDLFLQHHLDAAGRPGAYGDLVQRAPDQRTDWIRSRLDPRRRQDLKLANGRALYDAEVRAVDRGLGQLFAHLKQLDLYDRALIAVFADHGENLENPAHSADWIAFSHERLFEGVLRIPLILKLPQQREGRRISALSQNLDLVPTVLDVLGLDGDARIEGRSLLPLVRGQREPLHDFVFSEASGFEELSVRTEELKYIEPGEDADPLLFDWRRDLSEETDLFEQAGDDLRDSLAAELAAYRVNDRWRLRIDPSFPGERIEFQLDLAQGTLVEVEGPGTLSNSEHSYHWSGEVPAAGVEFLLVPRLRETQLNWRFARLGASAVQPGPNWPERIHIGQRPLGRSTAIPVWHASSLPAPAKPLLSVSAQESQIQLLSSGPAGLALRFELRFEEPGYGRVFKVLDAPDFSSQLFEEHGGGGARLRLSAESGADPSAAVLDVAPDAPWLLLARADGEWLPAQQINWFGKAIDTSQQQFVFPFPRRDARITGAALAAPRERRSGGIDLWLETGGGGVEIDGELVDPALADELRSLGYVK